MTPTEIRAIRARHAATQPRFAALLNVSLDTVKSWETGRMQPGPENVAKLRHLAEEKPIRVRRAVETLRETAILFELDGAHGMAAQLRRIADNHERTGNDPVQIIPPGAEYA